MPLRYPTFELLSLPKVENRVRQPPQRTAVDTPPGGRRDRAAGTFTSLRRSKPTWQPLFGSRARNRWTRTVAPAITAAWLCAILLNLAAVGSELHAASPNIVIILVDDLGYGDPGCFNPRSKIDTPTLNAVAAAGMKFTDAHAPGPLCHMSRYGLMTGRYPFRATVDRWRKEPSIAKGQTTLASMLKQQGYRTAMVGKWHLGFAEKGYTNPLPGGPVDVGFESYFGIRASTDIPPYFYIRNDRAVAPPTLPIAARSTAGWSPIQGEFIREGLIAPDMQLEEVLPRFTDEAISVIVEHAAQNKSDSRRPLFMYLAYPAPHTPWLPSEEFRGKSEVPLYGDFVEMVDAMIGRVLATLEQADMSEETLLIISSDNGPVWYDADVEKYGHDSCYPWRGMKSDAWEAGHRMPMVVRWPGKVAAQSSSDRLVSFTDFLATLATLTGYELAEHEGPDSFDFSDVLLQSNGRDSTVSLQTPPREAFVMKSGSGFMTIRDGDWKLIDQLGSGGFSQPRRVEAQPGQPSVQLYDLSNDPGETNNLAAEHPEIVAKLTKQMQVVVQSESHR